MLLILSLARLPIPPLSHAKSAVKDSTEAQPRINADDADFFILSNNPLYNAREFLHHGSRRST